MADTLIVVSKIKELIKTEDLRTSKEFLDKLSYGVEVFVKNAAASAKAAGRKTVMPEDLK
jgi:histone H3/H4